jgi:hypothetical protein
MAITPIPVRLPPGAPIDVASTDNQTPAVQGTSLASAWRFPIPTPFGGAIGVIGTSGSGVGVQGTSETGAGVLGTSQNYDGVHGESQSNGHPESRVSILAVVLTGWVCTVSPVTLTAS